MTIKIEAAQRLMAMPNSMGGLQEEVQRMLKDAKYQVTVKGSSELVVSNGSIANVAGVLKHRGWVLKGSTLTHGATDYSIRLKQTGDRTTLTFAD